MNQRSPKSGASESVGGSLASMEIDQSVNDDAEEEFDFNQILRAKGRLSSGIRRNNSLPPRTTLWVLIMLTVGTVMLVLGFGAYYDEWFGEEEVEASVGLSMIGLGALMFIPGSYGSYTLYGAWNRWEGFAYNNIPNYGD